MSQNATPSQAHCMPANRAAETLHKEAIELDNSLVKHRLDSLVEAGLADVVKRLRASWIAGPALLWGDVHPIREVSRGEFDQRVAATLVDGFLNFSQFLAGFEVLILELEKRGVVTEQSLLGLEKRVVHGGNFFGHKVEVPNAAECFGDVSGDANGCGYYGEVCQVHVGSCDGCVRTTTVFTKVSTATNTGTKVC